MSPTPPTAPPTSTSLHRTINLSQITLYGVGTIVGAGIYVLIGEVAAASGPYMAVSFLVAALIASFSAYAYSQLAQRFPGSAGAALYTLQAFRSKTLASMVGLTVAFSGIVSAATLANGFTGYFGLFVPLPSGLIITFLVVAMTAIAAFGIRLSIWVAVTTTVLELAGLAMVISAGSGGLTEIISSPDEYLLPGLNAWHGVGAGAFLAFFALIGFEDMVTLAEEVKQPEKNLPRGIFLALAVTAVLYVLVALSALAALPLADLVSSQTPLALVVERNTDIPPSLIAGIGLIAIVNGILLQIVMVARVLYGMSSRRLAPERFAGINSRTRTPLFATILVGGLVLGFALALPLVTLAKTTSTAILMVFTLVNLSLARILWLEGKKRPVPLLVSSIGAIICVIFLVLQW